jgi:benzylsuccinate CoA-transferase BbsE subunit
MLSPYRVLDLTDEKGLFCSKILADLGADVIHIERPHGNSARMIPPFYGNTPGPEKSLFWFAFSAGKRGITLNLDTEAGKDILKILGKTADFLVESYPVGYLDGIGLGYDVLRKENPGIIMASITPFGETGPYKDYKAGDLIASAMGGMVYCTGEPDRAPIRISIDQAYCQASVHAAAGLMIALTARANSGRGQHIDVSMQAGMVRTLHTQLPYWEYSRHIVQRSGVWRFRGGAATREIWPCKDGFVSWMFFGGAVGTQQMQLMVKWMEARGMAGSLSGAVQDWSKVDLTKVSQDTIKGWEKIIGDFFGSFTKKELYGEALTRRIPLTPLNSIPDVVRDEQLATRDFWVDVEHPELGTSLHYPGPFFKTSNSAVAPEIQRRAPLLGKHNREIYGGEMGLRKDEMDALAREGII